MTATPLLPTHLFDSLLHAEELDERIEFCEWEEEIVIEIEV